MSKTVTVSDDFAQAEWDSYDVALLRKNEKPVRAWSFLIYPEWDNITDVFRNIYLADCSYFISPLHLDLREDGEEAKPHYHVLVLFKNVRRASAIRVLFGLQPDYAVFQCVNHLGYIRYLCHYGREEKKQYPREQIQTNNNFMLNRAFSSDLTIDDGSAIQILNDILKHNNFECEFDLEVFCYEHGLENIYHKCRYSIHSSWEILQLRAKRNIVDMKVAQFRFIEPDHFYQDEQLSWEDIING